MKGKPKGLKAVCTEIFGEDAVKGLRQDGLIALLEKELDFRSRKYRLQIHRNELCGKGNKVNIATANAFRNAKTMVEEQAEARGDVIIFCAIYTRNL